MLHVQNELSHASPEKNIFSLTSFISLISRLKHYITCKLYICILWIPSKHNFLLNWFWDMLLLHHELLYMQIYVETVKLKSKDLMFDYMKCIFDLLICWLIKGSSIDWNDKIIDDNTTWILLFQLRGFSHWYMEHSWSLLKNFIGFSSH